MKIATVAKRGAQGWAGAKVVSRAMPRRRRGHSDQAVAGAFGLGAATAFALSRLDRRRRHMAVDRTASAGRDAAGATRAKSEHAAGRAKGLAHTVTGALRGDRDYDDATLQAKVESELFRTTGVPKGPVAVTVANGVVELRGELPDADQVQALGDGARRIEGVKTVRNLVRVADGR